MLSFFFEKQKMFDANMFSLFFLSSCEQAVFSGGI